VNLYIFVYLVFVVYLVYLIFVVTLHNLVSNSNLWGLGSLI
jgi:hypothetical protein